MTVKEIARLLDAPFDGDGSRVIRTAAALEDAGPDQAAFVESKSAAAGAAVSRAGCLLVAEEFPALDGPALIRVRQPRMAFARLVRALCPAPRPEAGVHDTAIVADSATLGSGVHVGPYVVIGDGAVIGDGCVIQAGSRLGDGVELGAGCWLYPGVTVYHGVRIGDRAILHSGCVIGADGFGYVFGGGRYEKFPQIGGVRIGGDVEIGANACVDRGALGDTVIEDGVKLDNMVHIGHNCRLGKHVVIAAQTGLSGGVVVEDYVVMGGQVGISEKARIETRAIVGAQCGILPYKVLKSGETYWGTPSRPHREHLKKLALVEKLPKLTARIEELEAKLKTMSGGQ